MFAPLFGAVRADIDRQIDWAKEEVRHQTRHAVLVGIFLSVAALAVFGAIVIGLVALYVWLTPRYGPFIALGMIGGGLLVLAVIMLVLALVRRRPQIAARPPLQMAQPEAMLGALGQDSYAKAMSGGEQVVKFVTENLREGSRSTLFGTLAAVAILGLILGRGLKR
jgi:Putative Actinobacterial Holin-X, holin superfamily III